MPRNVLRALCQVYTGLLLVIGDSSHNIRFPNIMGDFPTRLLRNLGAYVRGSILHTNLQTKHCYIFRVSFFRYVLLAVATEYAGFHVMRTRRISTGERRTTQNEDVFLKSHPSGKQRRSHPQRPHLPVILNSLQKLILWLWVQLTRDSYKQFSRLKQTPSHETRVLREKTTKTQETKTANHKAGKMTKRDLTVN